MTHKQAEITKTHDGRYQVDVSLVGYPKTNLVAVTFDELVQQLRDWFEPEKHTHVVE